MTDYTKSILLSLKTEFDKNELNKVTEEFAKLSSVKILDNEQIEDFKKAYLEMQEKLYDIKELEKAIKEMEMFGGDEETLQEMYSTLSKLNDEVEDTQNKFGIKDKKDKDEKKASTLKDATKQYFGDFKSELKNGFSRQIENYLGPAALANKVIKLVDNGVEYIKQGFKDAWEELKEISSFNIGSTSTYNSKVYSLMQEYGVSGSQAYALKETMNKMGFSSSDDMMIGLSSSKALQDKFSEFMKLYQERYEETYDEEMLSGIEEFNNQITELKEDFQTSIMQFIVDNKDEIMWGLKTGISILQGLMNGVSGLFKIFSTKQEMSETERQSKVNDILGITSTTTNNSTNNTNNVNVNSTINYPQTDTATIKNLPQLEYEAVIKALKEA